jgi:hypothetical protein
MLVQIQLMRSLIELLVRWAASQIELLRLVREQLEDVLVQEQLWCSTLVKLIDSSLLEKI